MVPLYSALYNVIIKNYKPNRMVSSVTEKMKERERKLV